MGLVDLEQPAGRRPPQFRIVQGAQAVECGQQVDRGGGRAGERAQDDDPLLALVVGGVDGGQVADQQGHQSQPDRRLHEGQPDPGVAGRLGEAQREQRRSADFEGAAQRSGLDAPEDEAEGDGHRDHPHQREGDQGDRCIQSTKVCLPILVPPPVDEDPVGHGEHESGDAGVPLAGQDDRLQRRDEHRPGQHDTDQDGEDPEQDHGSVPVERSPARG